MGAPQSEGGAARPIGTVTFLLTDIAGSTRLWETDRAAASGAVERHNAIIDATVALHAGFRPLEQGEGDSTVAVFPTASAAVTAAADIQRALHELDAGSGIRVRIGLHTGEAHVLGDGSYGGPAVIRCARLRDIAHGGQTLLSQSAAAVVADDLPDGAYLIDLGEHRLRDLARPERVFQLCQPGGCAEFPPLATAAQHARLPVSLTSFIGRGAEIHEVLAVLEGSRLVTLTGAGGCGKTRLALEVARVAADRFRDGADWVDLSSLADGGALAAATMAALGLHQAGAVDHVESLCAHLRSRSSLIVFDNCEHVAAAAALLTDVLLTRCPDLTVLATSREPLGAAGETAWHVPSLTVPTDVDRHSSSEAVQLFVDRAMKSRRTFRLDDASAAHVSDICRRLDGIPLAIELAAVRVRTLSVRQIVDGLSDRFLLLSDGARTGLPRQRTLEASVDWSHGLLTEDEQRLLRRLSVFAGAFSVEAAEAVTADDHLAESAVLDVLSRLVDRSLVQVDDAGALGRYRMLETIRDYARRKLNDAGEAAETRTRHAGFFVRMAEALEPAVETSDVVRAVDDLETELDNIRAAIEWSISAGDADRAMRLTSALLPFWFVRHLSEGLARIEDAIELAGGPAPVRAKAVTAAAAIATWSFSDGSRAQALAEEAAELARGVGDDRSLGRAIEVLAFQSAFTGGADARALLDQAREIADGCGDGWFSYLSRAHLGFLETVQGNCPAATAVFEQSVALARGSRNSVNLVESLAWSGFVAILSGRFDEADRLLAEATSIGRESKHDFYVPKCLEFSAFRALLSGQYEEARALLNEELEFGRRVGNAATTTTPATMWLADLSYAEGDLDTASELITTALTMYRAMWFPWGVSFSLVLAAIIAEAKGDTSGWSRSAQEALAVARAGTFQRDEGRALQSLARLAHRSDELDRAEDLEHEALRIFVRCGLRIDVINVIEELASLALAKESYAEAARIYAAAAAARRNIGCVRPGSERGALDAELGALRDAMGDDFEAAWSGGQALPIEDVVAYVTRARGERRRPSHGWASLTPTEVEVVKLVRGGLTNPQIAERMFIARGTVRSHLTHIFGKVGVSTRSELAAEAARRDL